jgi:hypothetical protein
MIKPGDIFTSPYVLRIFPAVDFERGQVKGKHSMRHVENNTPYIALAASPVKVEYRKPIGRYREEAEDIGFDNMVAKKKQVVLVISSVGIGWIQLLLDRPPTVLT